LLISVPYVKAAKTIQNIRPHLLTIKAHATFGQAFTKIKNTKNIDFV